MHIKRFLPGIAWFFLVLLLICMPGKQFPVPNPFLQKIFFDKWVHFGLFAILTFLWLYPLSKIEVLYNSKLYWAFKICLAFTVWGITTEFIQKYFVPYRSFDWWDWAADTVGVVAAYLFWRKKYLL